MTRKKKTAVIAAVAVVIISGGLVWWASTFVEFDGLVPRDKFMEGEDTTYSAPIGGFVMITVGIAVGLWIISAFFKWLGKKRDEKIDEEEAEAESQAEVPFRSEDEPKDAESK